MATIKINGTTYTVPDGASVSIHNGSVVINGSSIMTGLSGNVHVEWHGDLAKLDCQSCTIHGNVAGNVDAQSVKCGNVGGDIDAQSVTCGDVNGDIDAMSVTRR